MKCTPQGDESPQGGSTLQGDLVPHKVDRVYTRWTVLHKVEGAEHKDSTRWTMSPQSDYSTGWTVPRKVDCVYTRWTVSTQGGQVSTRLNVQYINTK